MTIRSLVAAALVVTPMLVAGQASAAVTARDSSGVAAGAPASAITAAGDESLATASAARSASPVGDALLYRGFAFDTCAVPSVDDMLAWRAHSPYRAVGIYIGGNSSSCKKYNAQHLTREWVTKTLAMGWRLIPIYVGSQAPCAVKSNGDPFTHQIDAKTAGAQGNSEARDAIAQMRRLGLGAGNPIYENMENWDHTDHRCTGAVLDFLNSWTVELHRAGYISGLYASAGNGMPAIVTAQKTDASFHAPDAIWFARHDNKRTYFDVGDPKYISDDVYTSHTRIKQYRGPHDETRGGVTIHIDSNYVDAPVVGTVLGLGPSSLPMVTAGTEVSQPLTVPSGTRPYSFTVTAGRLPAGLTLSHGTIVGRPTRPGTSTAVTIRVTDSGHPTRSGSRTYTIYTTFADMPKSQLFFGPVKWLARNGITFGYSDGTFRPGTAVNRGSMAAFLYRFANPGSSPSTCTKKPFPDVATGDLFCGHIAWLKGQHITKPADGNYHTSNSVTRGSMTAFLYRLTHPGKPSPRCTGRPFPDVPTDNVFCGYIQWAKDHHIADGYPNGTYGPDRAVTRGAMAAFLQRISRYQART